MRLIRLGIAPFFPIFFKFFYFYIYIFLKIHFCIIVRLIQFIITVMENGKTQQSFQNAFYLILQHAHLETTSTKTTSFNLQNI
jgi:hypothetical protein